MMKLTLPFKKPLKSLFFIQHSFLIGIIILSFSIGKSQKTAKEDSVKVLKLALDKFVSINTTKSVKVVDSNATKTSTVLPVIKIGEHAPASADWNNTAKMQEWMSKYPEEYDAFMKQYAPTAQDVKSDSVKTVTNQTEEVKTVTEPVPVPTELPVNPFGKPGFHAPDPADPNFAAKLQEWKEKYPDEYKASQK